jgi:hypothetical protein
MSRQKLFLTASGTDSAAPVTEGVAVSSTTTYYSKVWTGSDSDTCGIHLEWSGTPTGTFTLWMSDKYAPDETSDTDWVQDTGFSPSNPAGAAGKFRDDMSQAPARRKRIKYVNASGSGTLKGWATVFRMKA